MTQTPVKDPSTNGATPEVSEVKAQFQAMLAPSSKAVSRKAWGIDVSTIWLPYFTAAKTVGAVDDVDLPDASLGAPFRLRRDKDTNEVRFSATSRPMFFVAPELNAMVNRARDNYIAGLIQQTAAVHDENPELYEAQVERQANVAIPSPKARTSTWSMPSPSGLLKRRLHWKPKPQPLPRAAAGVPLAKPTTHSA